MKEERTSCVFLNSLPRLPSPSLTIGLKLIPSPFFDHLSISSRYDADLRVPLLIRGPGIPKGLTIKELVGLPDLAPTILELTVPTRA